MENKNDFNGITLRAAIDSGSINVEERSFDVTIATENPITERSYKYMDSYDKEPETYNEVLSCTPEAVRASRLEVGVPLFPSHWDRSAMSQLGITTEYVLADRACKAKIKLGARADSALWKDIQDGIIKTVSVGAKIYKAVRTIKDGMPEYTATDWEVMHVALAPEPADISATIMRSSDMVIDDKSKKVEEKPLKGITFNSIINKF